MLHRLIIDSPSFKRVIYLQDSCYSIGRHPSNAIVIPSPQISRKQATLVKKINANLETYFYIIDGDLEGNRSRNGLWINGESYIEKELQHGDKIFFSSEIKAFYQVLVTSTEHGRSSALGDAPLPPINTSLKSPQEQWDATMIPFNHALQDISEEQLKKLAGFVEFSPYPVLEIDRAGQITYLNVAAREKFQDLEQLNIHHPLLKDLVTLPLYRNDYLFSREVSIHQKVFEQHIYYLPESQLIRSYVFDITERKVAEQTLNYQAFYDPLTDLPNRFLFKQFVSDALTSAQHHNSAIAVLFLQVKGLQSISDTLGNLITDEILCAITARLNSLMNASARLARWDRDQFTIVLTGLKHPKNPEIVDFTHSLLESLQPPFLIENHPFYLHGTVGIATYPEHGEDSETLLLNANAALSNTGNLTEQNYQFYSSTITSRHSNRLQLERELHQAMEKGEFLLHYQPQINLKTGRVSGIEALVRWQHPKQGLVFPNQFISLAEESGLILALGKQVLQIACEQNRHWQQLGLGGMRVSVNLSARQFQQPDLVPMISEILQETGLDPRWLELEITETTVMKDIASACQIVQQLQAMGVSLAMDDFGIGYSSLSYLKQFPFDTLKIDQTFVREVENSPQNSAIIAAALTLGRGFNLKVIVEGVETESQMQCLKALGCEEMQGYWFSLPLSSSEMTNFLQQEKQSGYGVN